MNEYLRVLWWMNRLKRTINEHRARITDKKLTGLTNRLRRMDRELTKRGEKDGR